MSSNAAGIIFVLFFLIILAFFTLRAKRRQTIGEETESSIEEISFWRVTEETSNRLALKIESTDTIISLDLDTGLVTRFESEAKEILNRVEIPISQIDSLLLSIEDAPTGIDPCAKLALVTKQGEKLPIIQGYRYIEVVSPIAKKVSGFIQKEIEEEILAHGTFWVKEG